MQTIQNNKQQTTDDREQKNLPSAVCRLQTDLSPELFAIEAALATATPQMDAAVRERMKAAALFETCRLTLPELPNLVETIVASGEQEITLSLRRYVKMERFQAMTLGILFGLVIGVIVNLIGLTVIVRYWQH